MDDAKPWGEDLAEHVTERLTLKPVEEADPLMAHWARFRDRLADAMRDGFWTIEDLERRVFEHKAFFFPGREAAVVAEIQTFPGGRRVMQALWACGDVEEILTMIPGIESMARMMGCDETLVEGQLAWKRVLEPLGYRFFSVTLRKAL
jgi:hypothetical protein